MFQDRLRKLRKERNLSQDDVGQSLNLGGRTIGNYESGERLPALDTLVKLADFYEVSIDYLLGRTDNRHLNSTTSEMSIFESLPPEAYEELKILLEFLQYKYADH
ncbi:MAG: helix-turn-helix domain-containing protein [Bacteroidota bacterium]